MKMLIESTWLRRNHVTSIRKHYKNAKRQVPPIQLKQLLK